MRHGGQLLVFCGLVLLALSLTAPAAGAHTSEISKTFASDSQPKRSTDAVKSLNLKIMGFTIFSRKFENIVWRHVDARGGQWKNLTFQNFDIEFSNFSGLRIQHSKFLGGRIRTTDLRSLFISDTSFEDAILPEKIKTDAILINVEFRNCRFEK